ncbi:hypothetical protein ES703_04037 [subsurface metagenome]
MDDFTQVQPVIYGNALMSTIQEKYGQPKAEDHLCLYIMKHVWISKMRWHVKST